MMDISMRGNCIRKDAEEGICCVCMCMVCVCEDEPWFVGHGKPMQIIGGKHVLCFVETLY